MSHSMCPTSTIQWNSMRQWGREGNYLLLVESFDIIGEGRLQKVYGTRSIFYAFLDVKRRRCFATRLMYWTLMTVSAEEMKGKKFMARFMGKNEEDERRV